MTSDEKSPAFLSSYTDPLDRLRAADLLIRTGALHMAESKLRELDAEEKLPPEIRRRLLDKLARIAERRGQKEKADHLKAEAAALPDGSAEEHVDT